MIMKLTKEFSTQQ